MQLWRCAIIRSVASLLLRKKYFLPYLSTQRRDLINSEYDRFLPSGQLAQGVYHSARDLLARSQTASQFREFCGDPKWRFLEDELSDLLAQSPPIFIYLDAIDEEFAHAPMEWQRCQKGLFYTVMRLLREPKLGGRLHVVICIRDIVLSSVYVGEHQTRYRQESHIRLLNWDREAIRYFLLKKLEQLPQQFFVDPDKLGVKSWLGFDQIYNARRGIVEPMDNYLIRHTRCLPRDIIQLGNALSLATMRNRMVKRNRSEWESRVRGIVSKFARHFGNEQLQICANQLASHELPRFAAKHRYSEFYTSVEEYIELKTHLLKKIIKDIGCERFSREEMDVARELYSSELLRGWTYSQYCGRMESSA